MASKEQHSIMYVIKDGREIDFERFTAKTERGAVNWLKYIVAENKAIIAKEYLQADLIRVYLTKENGASLALEDTPVNLFRKYGMSEDLIKKYKGE